ncbi:MAG: hypothetical protein ACJAWW_001132 [Sulfurimonas sp.]|jgi:hypothetical protein
MNLSELKNKTVLIFGQSRAFSADEFKAQMKFHKITLSKEYNKDVALIVDGKMMTPYEQNASDKLYEEKKCTFVNIDILEKELAKHIDADTLLMSLKLSHDKDRLKDFLTNSMISDEFYLRLLKMYAWGGEGFFDNDDNRDVSAALIVRFYENIERNHNVEYAALGIMHLVAQSINEDLIETISLLEPIQKSLEHKSTDANNKIISAIVTNYATPKNVLNMFIKKSNSYIRTLIAMRKDCSQEMQKNLFNCDDEEVNTALSYSYNLEKTVLQKLIVNEKFAKNMATYICLNDELFELFFKSHPDYVAKNETISLKMQKRLMANGYDEVLLSLATNEQIDETVVLELLSEESKAINYALYENSATPKDSLEDAYKDAQNHFALSNNENTPKHILEQLAQSADIKVLKSLAKNPSTPIDILYQLQLDARLERAVKENPQFGKHIMSENIGWEI